jgi:hypothetical protein
MDPVERACRELARLGFLKSYAIAGKYVADATIELEMPDDYQPSETFTLPFEAIIDSFRKDADAGDSTEPVARGGLWREQSDRLKKVAGRSAKARDAAAALARAVFERFGPSAGTLEQAIELVAFLGECGIRPHTAIPETARLVAAEGLDANGLTARTRRSIDWWTRKRESGERVGPGLLVAALRDPDLAAADASARDAGPAEPERTRAAADEAPTASDVARGAWEPIREAMRVRFGAAAVRDWLDPVVPVALAPLASSSDTEGGEAGRPSGGELTLWVPNSTFRRYLGGDGAFARALKQEAASRSVGRLTIALDA